MTDTANILRQTTLTVGSGDAARDIAVITRIGTGPERPALVWLGGYRSDMAGTKAIEMDALARDQGLTAIRFDYSGHGVSGGDFRLGTISRWTEEALAVLASSGVKKAVLIGSSMGGWIALRVIQEARRLGLPFSIDGLVLIAPAPDFTAELIEPGLTAAERQSLAERGYFEEPSEYSSEPNIFTRALMDDGAQNRVLIGLIETGCPVHILQGMKDPDVPYQHALKLMEFLPLDDVVLTLIRDGDHRLSRPEDIAKMKSAILSMI
ncbi:Pimeloyl-ACP methyl ester carboxylesterase [Rhizobium sp. RU33A]|uniref:alpha/beta hydrolase n=1 Tax=Rhizobium sp. RU33A TaxID=1907413 RepID=UPI000956238E|nr:alpha/beta hydrolase [Rhizobium sp. RU33A]SIP92922.1 Pimeloyl-ACP methyl ester carboxylesterase [Rhizobium sp. RU33A]